MRLLFLSLSCLLLLFCLNTVSVADAKNHHNKTEVLDEVLETDSPTTVANALSGDAEALAAEEELAAIQEEEEAEEQPIEEELGEELTEAPFEEKPVDATEAPDDLEVGIEGTLDATEAPDEVEAEIEEEIEEEEEMEEVEEEIEEEEGLGDNSTEVVEVNESEVEYLPAGGDDDDNLDAGDDDNFDAGDDAGIEGTTNSPVAGDDDDNVGEEFDAGDDDSVQDAAGDDDDLMDAAEGDDDDEAFNEKADDLDDDDDVDVDEYAEGGDDDDGYQYAEGGDDDDNYDEGGEDDDEFNGEDDDLYGNEDTEDEYGDDRYSDKENPWEEPVEQPKLPYVPPDDDPVQAEAAIESSQWDDDQYNFQYETPKQMMHDRNVIILAGCLCGLALLLMIHTAHQMISNPDGFCASICRLAVSITCFFTRIICFPCILICGNKDRRTHDPISHGHQVYTHDLELS